MKRWVNAAMLQMKRNDEFWRILRANSPRQFWRFFLTNVPRPKTKEAYPRGRVPESGVPSLRQRLSRGGRRVRRPPRSFFHGRLRRLRLAVHLGSPAGALGWPEGDPEARCDRHRRVVSRRPGPRRCARLPDPGDQPARRGLRRADPQHADPRADLPDRLRAAEADEDPPVRLLLRRVPGADHLGRRLQHGELPRGVRGCACALSRGRLRAGLRAFQDLPQRLAADRRADLRSRRRSTRTSRSSRTPR